MSDRELSASGPASEAATAPELEWHAPRNPWLIAGVATVSTFMEVLDSTIVNVSLPHIAGTLGATPIDSTWVLTSYLIANAIVLPLSAWFGSLFGRKNFYMACVVLFTGSSLLCGIAPSLGALVVFRMIQGAGGGGLQPSTQAIMVDTFPPEQRGMGMALYAMTVVVAPVIGPTLGGWITDNYSWRWIFLINVPVGALSLMLTARYISDPPYLVRRRGPNKYRADFIGLGLLALGLGCLQLVLDIGQRNDWFESRLIVVAASVSALALIGVVWWELRHPDPVVNLRLLADRNLGLSLVTMVIFGSVLYGTTVLLPLFMQTLLGYTAMWSGLAISPGALLMCVLMPVVGWLVSRLDPRWMISAGVVIIAASLQAMARFNLEISFGTIVTARLMQSLGLAFIFVPLITAAYANVPKEMRGSASGLISLSRNTGGSLGIAFASTMISRLSQFHHNHLVDRISVLDPRFSRSIDGLGGHLGRTMGDPIAAAEQARAMAYAVVQQQAATLAFTDVFRILTLMVLPVLGLVWLTRRVQVGPETTAL